MLRKLLFSSLFAVLSLSFCFAADKTSDANKEALQKLQDFIGEWKGNGGPPPNSKASKLIWSETFQWGWRFKGDDSWLTLEVKDGKFFKNGELKWVPEKKIYQFTVSDLKDNKMVFDGKLNKDILTLERIDPKTKETQKLEMNNAAEGVRFIYNYSHKEQGKTLFIKDYMVAATKSGMSLGAKEKKTECVVSGGLGTMPVSFKGETFYVCCSGCKDAFIENPEKFVKEFKAKKAAGGE